MVEENDFLSILGTVAIFNRWGGRKQACLHQIYSGLKASAAEPGGEAGGHRPPNDGVGEHHALWAPQL